MLVQLSDHIRGFCHALHYADVPLKHPEKKLTEGKKVKCRVNCRVITYDVPTYSHGSNQMSVQCKILFIICTIGSSCRPRTKTSSLDTQENFSEL